MNKNINVIWSLWFLQSSLAGAIGVDASKEYGEEEELHRNFKNRQELAVQAK